MLRRVVKSQEWDGEVLSTLDQGTEVDSDGRILLLYLDGPGECNLEFRPVSDGHLVLRLRIITGDMNRTPNLQSQSSPGHCTSCPPRSESTSLSPSPLSFGPPFQLGDDGRQKNPRLKLLPHYAIAPTPDPLSEPTPFIHGPRAKRF